MSAPSWSDVEIEMTVPQRIAFLAMYELSDESRGLVMTYFCHGCYRYTGNVDECHCTKDE